MAKVIKQHQNIARALEVRMEQINSTYQVVLAGMTIHHGPCRNGTCEGNFMFTDNHTYRVLPCITEQEAMNEFEVMKR